MYQPNGQFKAWLFTIARRLLVDEIRRMSKLQYSEQIEVITEKAVQYDNQPVELFNNALSSLPFEQREAYCLQQEGFSLKDIEVITGTKLETIKSRLRYARKTLMEALNQIDLERGYDHEQR